MRKPRPPTHSRRAREAAVIHGHCLFQGLGRQGHRTPEVGIGSILYQDRTLPAKFVAVSEGFVLGYAKVRTRFDSLATYDPLFVAVRLFFMLPVCLSMRGWKSKICWQRCRFNESSSDAELQGASIIALNKGHAGS